MTDMHQLRLYSRHGCHLCGCMARHIEKWLSRNHSFARENGIQLKIVDVTMSSADLKLYGHRIPVLLFNHVVIAEGNVSECRISLAMDEVIEIISSGDVDA